MMKIFSRIIITIILTLGFSLSLQSLLAAVATMPTEDPPYGNPNPPIANDASSPNTTALINRGIVMVSGDFVVMDDLRLVDFSDCTYLYTDSSGYVMCSASEIGGGTVAAGDVDPGTFNGDYMIDGNLGITGYVYTKDDDTFNTAFGENSLANITTGKYNVAVGYNSLKNNRASFFNVGIGYEALSSVEYGGYAIGIGYHAGSSIVSSGLIAIGTYALASSTGAGNIAIGNHALKDNTVGINNTALGDYALQNNLEGNSNIAIGPFAMNDNLYSEDNTAIGSRALSDHVNGDYNVAIGKGTLYYNIEGAENTFVGTYSGYLSDTSSYNTSLGFGTLRDTGDGNIAIGYMAGRDWTGDNHLFIDNSSTADPLIEGDFDTDEIMINGGFSVSTLTNCSGLSTDSSGKLTCGGAAAAASPVSEIPSGAVMAFNLSSCPDGWSEYTAARGRTVVGRNSSDSDFSNIGQTGGEKTHTLTVDEMPSHYHLFYHGAFGSSIYSVPTNAADNQDATLARVKHTTNVGGDDPHNNLQPYISLLYCEKD